VVGRNRTPNMWHTAAARSRNPVASSTATSSQSEFSSSSIFRAQLRHLATKLSARRSDSYTCGDSFDANISSKWQFPSVGPLGRRGGGYVFPPFLESRWVLNRRQETSGPNQPPNSPAVISHQACSQSRRDRELVRKGSAG
jgi:hypothetical protein